MAQIKCRYGAIPRILTDHRSPEGVAYRRYCEGIIERYGKLPAIALPTLREAGRLFVDLNAIGLDLEQARRRKRRKDVARFRRAMTPMRTQLLTLERRLEELVTDQPRHPLDALASLSEVAP